MRFSIKDKLPMCYIIITCKDWLIIIYQILQYTPMLNYFVILLVWLKDNDFYIKLIKSLIVFSITIFFFLHNIAIDILFAFYS